MIDKEKIIINKIKSNFLKSGSITKKDLLKIDHLVKENPSSPSLWCFRGDLIQLSNGGSYWNLNDALKSYRRAIALDSNYQEAYIEATYYHYAVHNSPKRAMKYLQKALKIKPTKALLKLKQEIQKEINNN